MLSEPTADDIPVVCSEVPDGGLSLLDSAGQEVTQAVSRASSTLEGSVQCQDASLSHPTPMEATEGLSALEVATAEDLDVHVGLSPPRYEGATTVHASTVLNEPVALEVGELDARSLMSAGGAEITPDDALQIIPANLPSSSHDKTLPTLGLPQFFSNLQVSRRLALTSFISVSYISSTHLSLITGFCRWNVCSAEILWCHCPRISYVSDAMESIATSETD
jgi:hypothetical protein